MKGDRDYDAVFGTELHGINQLLMGAERGYGALPGGKETLRGLACFGPIQSEFEFCEPGWRYAKSDQAIGHGFNCTGGGEQKPIDFAIGAALQQCVEIVITIRGQHLGGGIEK
jgi:hypothetical protein